MSSDAQWQVTASLAKLQAGLLAGQLDLSHLAAGLRGIQWNGHPCDDFEVLRTSITTDSQLLDCYIRGTDLVATYSQSGTCAVAPHCYWRLRHHSQFNAVAIEMILSVQTDLLDSQPAAVVRSMAQNVRVFHCAGLADGNFQQRSQAYHVNPQDYEVHLVVLRHEGAGLSYAQLVHPTDLEALQLQFRLDGKSGAMAVVFQKPHLEKGVIRRARIYGWFLPAESDLRVSAELARRSLEEPLPLTA
jgi:hypothetical protein